VHGLFLLRIHRARPSAGSAVLSQWAIGMKARSHSFECHSDVSDEQDKRIGIALAVIALLMPMQGYGTEGVPAVILPVL